MNIYLLFVFFVQLFFVNINSAASDKELYKVKYFRNEIQVDGVLSPGEWESADSIKGFIAPWNNEIHDQTVFKAIRSAGFFYFCFNVIDENLLVYDFKDELTVEVEDRVELFFSQKPDLKHYFCAEMDPQGKILDYSARFHRKFNNSWNFSQLRIVSKVTSDGYIVEGSIPIDELANLGMNDLFYMGIFRADYRSKKTEDVIWYSWIKPVSKTADFHIPSAFGLVKLEPVH